jgi:hypothetical protein
MLNLLRYVLKEWLPITREFLEFDTHTHREREREREKRETFQHCLVIVIVGVPCQEC